MLINSEQGSAAEISWGCRESRSIQRLRRLLCAKVMIRNGEKEIEKQILFGLFLLVLKVVMGESEAEEITNTTPVIAPAAPGLVSECTHRVIVAKCL